MAGWRSCGLVGFTLGLVGLVLTGDAVGAGVALVPGAVDTPPEMTVVYESQDGIELVIELPVLGVETHDLAGEIFQSLTLAGGELSGEPGTPALPTYTRFVAIPATAGVSLRIAAIEEETVTGLRLVPMQADDSAGPAFDRALYARDEFLGGEAVTIGKPAILRDLRVVPLTFRPVRFNPARNEVRIVRRVELALDHAGVDLRNAKTRPARPVSPVTAELYESTVVNARTEQTTPHRGTWLLISRDNAQVTAILQPLIAWRERMGFRVVHATTAETGTSSSSIKNWIQQAYDTWEYPPEYIVLVGDAGGSFSLPTFYETYSGYNGEGDHGYVMLEGNDLVPDAFTGRLSAEDTTTLERIVNKIIGYESAPYMTETSWFKRATLTGDPLDSGPTCVHIQQWLKEQLRIVGYAAIDTIFTEPFESRTLTRLNLGNSFYGYRGIYGMSGISSGDIGALQNGWKLTFALNLTCDTGTWAGGLSRSEAWLRGGSGTTNATGGIGSIGTATTGTHTRYNNCFYTGVAYGLFWQDHQCIGAAHARGKLEMMLNYNDPEPTQAARYCYWNTLIGDPATVIWTDVPQALTVEYPSIVPLGSNVVDLLVRGDGGAPVAGAWVHLHRDANWSQGGRTGADGRVRIGLSGAEAGEVLVTVTGPNLYAHRGSFTLQQADRFVGLHEFTVDDDNTGGTHGNADGRLNPGEQVGLTVTLRNFGPQPAPDVALTASCGDPLVGWSGPTTISFGAIGGYGLATASSPLTMRLFGGCPPGHVVRIDLEVASGGDRWISALDLPVDGPEMVFANATVSGVGTRLDPGESGTIVIELRNDGSLALAGPVRAQLASDSYAVEVTEPLGTYGTIAAGATGSNSGDAFGIRAPADCIPGVAALKVVLVDAAGIRQTVPLALTVGTADSHDPTGPDAYGYYAYDHTDTDYPGHPSYDWVEINPSSGGPGTSVGLDDYGDDEDDSATLDLPFPFRFYGEEFDRVTICSNGWLSLGQTYQVTYANYSMPCAFAPAYMVAGFWDDLRMSGTGQVYIWNDTNQHRYVVSWDNVRRRLGWQNYTESFQIILLDPAWYPTETGDGEILIQYETVNNVDSEGMYATSGIQNGDHTTGITFNYFNRRPPTAANLAAGLAVKFTTGAPGFTGVHGDPGRPRLLLEAGPNPWTAATTVRFALAGEGEAALRVLDLNGRVVRVLRRGRLAAGPQTLDWSGAGVDGTPLPAGVYLLQLEADGKQITRRTVRVR